LFFFPFFFLFCCLIFIFFSVLSPFIQNFCNSLPGCDAANDALYLHSGEAVNGCSAGSPLVLLAAGDSNFSALTMRQDLCYLAGGGSKWLLSRESIDWRCLLLEIQTFQLLPCAMRRVVFLTLAGEHGSPVLRASSDNVSTAWSAVSFGKPLDPPSFPGLVGRRKSLGEHPRTWRGTWGW
jgi:hypothetical protein